MLWRDTSPEGPSAAATVIIRQRFLFTITQAQFQHANIHQIASIAAIFSVESYRALHDAVPSNQQAETNTRAQE